MATLQPVPDFGPLVPTCRDWGISRSVAFQLAASGQLDTFLIGRRRYVRLESLRTLPDRIAARDSQVAA